VFLFSSIIVRPLRGDLGRALLTVLGVTLGVAVLLGIRKANEASLRGFRAGLEMTSGKAALEISAPPLGVREERVAELGWLREWGVASPVIQADVLAEGAGGSEMVPLIGIDGLRDYAVMRPEMAEAREAAGLDLMGLIGQPDQVLVTGALAKTLGVKVGEVVGVTFGDRRRELRVAAVLGGEPAARSTGDGGGEPASRSTGGAGVMSGSLLVMDIASAQVALERQGWVDRLEVRLHEGVDLAVAEAAVRARLPVGLTVQRPERRGEAVEKMLAAFHFNLTMLSTIALVVGLFLIYNTISVAVMTRRGEIGMLRTLGTTRGQILGLFLGEALLLAVVGAVLGVPVGWVLAQGAVMLTATTVDTLYVAHAAVVPGVEWWDAGLALGVAMPLAVVAAARPAWEAVRVPPVAAVRGAEMMVARRGVAWGALGLTVGCLLAGVWAARQPAVNGLPLWGYGAAVLTVVGIAAVTPVVLAGVARLARGVLGRVFGIEGRLAAGQVGASTGRLSVSVAALAVSLALTLAIAIMVGSFRQTVMLWVDQSMGADLYLRPATPPRATHMPSFSAETVAKLKGHGLVEAVDGYRALDVPYEDRLVKLGTGDYALQMERARVAMKTPGEVREILKRALEQEGVLVSEAFAMRFKKQEGDRITLNTVQGPVAFLIAGQFYDYSNDRGTITMDHRQFARYFGESNPTHLALYLRPGADAEGVKAELAGVLGEAKVLAFTNAGLRAEVLRIFDGTFAITWALELIAIVVAMAGVAATMLTLILDRQDEIRLLRLAGAEAGQVRRTVLIESGLIGAVSQGLGLVSGVLLSVVLIRVINPQSFGWSIQFHFPALFVAGSSVLTVVATMLAGVFPARRATRLMPRVAVAAGVLLMGMPVRAGEGWEPAKAGYEYAFPRDHGQHPEHKIEWWYYTGNLDGAGGERLGYQLTFFRIGAVKEPKVESVWALRDVWMAHFAITDATGKVYRHVDRLNRAGPGLAGAAGETLRVWNEDWSAVMEADGAMVLKAGDAAKGMALELRLGVQALPPVVHGRGGISQKGAEAGNASHYYSLTQLPTTGSVTLDGKRVEVSGLSWMDHEFGTSFLEAGQQGWDWFSGQFEDGGALMLFQLRHEAGPEKTRFAGTWVSPTGEVTVLEAGDFVLTPGEVWRSKETTAAYPVRWGISIPKLGVELECRAVMEGQEMRADLTPGLHYWEGAVDFSGTRAGKVMVGRGYLEMTGYAGRAMSAWFGGEGK
jgi:putative ABC transport system permease protein